MWRVQDIIFFFITGMCSEGLVSDVPGYYESPHAAWPTYKLGEKFTKQHLDKLIQRTILIVRREPRFSAAVTELLTLDCCACLHLDVRSTELRRKVWGFGFVLNPILNSLIIDNIRTKMCCCSSKHQVNIISKHQVWCLDIMLNWQNFDL